MTVPTTLMPANTLPMLPHDDCEEAGRLLERALEMDGLTKGRLLDALEAGFGLAMWGGDPAFWPATSAAQRDAAAAGRLVLKVKTKLGLPLEDLVGPCAKSVVRELLSL
jgi:hypothetical protein